jgi:hypothetical protein
MQQISFTQADYYGILSCSHCFVDLKLEALSSATHAYVYRGYIAGKDM